MLRSTATVTKKQCRRTLVKNMSGCCPPPCPPPPCCDPRYNKYLETQEVCEPQMSCVPRDPQPPCLNLPRLCPRPMPCDLEFYKLKKPIPMSRRFKCGKKIICEDTFGVDYPPRNKYLTDISISVRGPMFRDPYFNNKFF